MTLEPRHYLRAEGMVFAGVALITYFTFDGPLWILLLLVLAPDLSMLGYFMGPRVGSTIYNTVHTYALPLVMGVASTVTDTRLVLLVALVWVGHIGADRALGYGLKYESGFKDTHLSSQPTPVSFLR